MRTLIVALLLVLSSVATAQTKIPAPADVLGFAPGEDRKLASWNQVVEYFERLDQASDRLTFVDSSRGLRILASNPADLAAFSIAAAALLCPSPVSEERINSLVIN